MDDTESANEGLRDFLVECGEGLDDLESELVRLERGLGDAALVAKVFRTVHNIKGTSGFFGFTRLTALTHAGENLLGRMRDAKLSASPRVVSTLLLLGDALRTILGSIERLGTEPDEDFADLVGQLELAAAGGEEEEPPPTPRTAASAPAPIVAIAPTALKAPSAAPESLATTRPASPENNVRVNVRVLDRLMDLVGELVIARNQIVQSTANTSDPGAFATSQRLDHITSELQEGIMKTRMQPIGGVWSRFPRLVRDLAIACGKQVRLEMEGEQTELDRTIIEAVRDPFTHLVRNSIDHGLEAPEERARRGKSPVGTVRLRAYHAGGQVNIEISDDGRGLDTEQIRERAVVRGLVSRDAVGRMTERELINLIFLPGFSTAATVTDISGRGVGMDVVRTNVEKLGGTIDTQSQLGRGTLFRIKIPLTLAIIPALIVTTGGERYAIPQVSLVELVRLDPERATGAIETVFGTPVFRLRGALLPVVDLGAELGSPPGAPAADGAVHLVVVQAESLQFGLVVDDISDTQEIVVKPLGRQLKHVSVFAGATVLGDGSVALILDAVGFAQHAGVVDVARERPTKEADSDASRTPERVERLLLLGVGESGRTAVRLSQVARLEEFPASAIERVGRARVVQYRDEIMPLLDVAEELGDASGSQWSATSLQVVVHDDRGRSVGLVVDEVLDVVETTLAIQRRGARRGVSGTAVVDGRVTELLDLAVLVRTLDDGRETRTL